MEHKVRVDFIDHPSGNGYVVTVNGRRLNDPFRTVGEVLAFSAALNAPARYAGTHPKRVVSEGGRFLGGDEDYVVPNEHHD